MSHEGIVELIGATITSAGVKVRAKLDPRLYYGGIKAIAVIMRGLEVEMDEFHGEWNSRISPGCK